MKDALGRDVKKGDYIVYTQRSDLKLWLTIAWILSVDDGRATVDALDLEHGHGEIYRTYVENNRRIVIMPTTALTNHILTIFEGPLGWNDYSPTLVRQGRDKNS